VRGVAFPAAIKDHVFCIYSCNGSLEASNSNMNPKRRKNADNFAILGEDIEIHPGSGIGLISGTSAATALAAGLAGQILCFARQPGNHGANCTASQNYAGVHGHECVAEQLCTRSGMTAMLNKISRTHQKFRCIAPWLLWAHQTSPGKKELSRARIREVIEEALLERDR
jgi:hypothetical protein